MPASRNRGKRNRRRRALAEAAELFGPDRSMIVHEFGDGWTVRRIATPADEYREGLLMHHCLGVDTYLEGRSAFEDTFHSLRDPDNHPRSTFRHFAAAPGRSAYTSAPVGHGDVSPVKPDYARRIVAWHGSLPYQVVLGREGGGWPEGIGLASLPVGAPVARSDGGDTQWRAWRARAWREALADLPRRPATIEDWYGMLSARLRRRLEEQVFQSLERAGLA